MPLSHFERERIARLHRQIESIKTELGNAMARHKSSAKDFAGLIASIYELDGTIACNKISAPTETGIGATLIVNEKRIISAFDDGMERITGLKREEILGGDIAALFPFLTHGSRARMAEILAGNTCEFTVEYFIQQTFARGEAKIHLSPIFREGTGFEEERSVSGVVGIVTKIA